MYDLQQETAFDCISLSLVIVAHAFMDENKITKVYVCATYIVTLASLYPTSSASVIVATT